jgi:uncharacterized protein (TIGR00296 family)
LPFSIDDLTADIGDILLSISRNTLESIFQKKVSSNIQEHSILQEKSGVFCTLSKQGELRGCIGYPTPEYKLGDALTSATKHSALEDSRFPPVQASELELISIEITVLTPPEKLEVNSPDEYFNLIKIGFDGLIASKGQYHRGLLLPQVPVEQKWTVEEFLDHTCMKAGIFPLNSWKNIDEVTIERFQGKIFSEK